jgi:hypothetical protein
MRLSKKLNELGHTSGFIFTCLIDEDLNAAVSQCGKIIFQQNMDHFASDLFDADAIHAGVNGDDIPLVYSLKKKIFQKRCHCLWSMGLQCIYTYFKSRVFA